MKRREWQFPYTADKLLAAATEKHLYHGTRATWWEGKKAETLTKIKAEGLEIDESVAAGYSNKTFSREATVSVRDDLLRDLQECVQKMHEHREKISHYDAWVQVLASQGSATLMVDQEDWLFFFGKA